MSFDPDCCSGWPIGLVPTDSPLVAEAIKINPASFSLLGALTLHDGTVLPARFLVSFDGESHDVTYADLLALG